MSSTKQRRRFGLRASLTAAGMLAVLVMTTPSIASADSTAATGLPPTVEELAAHSGLSLSGLESLADMSYVELQTLAAQLPPFPPAGSPSPDEVSPGVTVTEKPIAPEAASVRSAAKPRVSVRALRIPPACLGKALTHQQAISNEPLWSIFIKQRFVCQPGVGMFSVVGFHPTNPLSSAVTDLVGEFSGIKTTCLAVASACASTSGATILPTRTQLTANHRYTLASSLLQFTKASGCTVAAFVAHCAYSAHFRAGISNAGFEEG